MSSVAPSWQRASVGPVERAVEGRVLTDRLRKQEISTDLQSGTPPYPWQLCFLLTGMCLRSGSSCASKFLSPEFMNLGAAWEGDRAEAGWMVCGREDGQTSRSDPFLGLTVTQLFDDFRLHSASCWPLLRRFFVPSECTSRIYLSIHTERKNACFS